MSLAWSAAARASSASSELVITGGAARAGALALGLTETRRVRGDEGGALGAAPEPDAGGANPGEVSAAPGRLEPNPDAVAAGPGVDDARDAGAAEPDAMRTGAADARDVGAAPCWLVFVKRTSKPTSCLGRGKNCTR